MRVVSLLPSATEMVHFAGAAETLVGVTHECDYPAGVEELPRLTSSRIDPTQSGAEIDAAVNRLVTDEESIYALDVDLLERLAPDLVITQGLCDVCAVSTSLVEEAVSGLRSKPELLVLNPTSLEDVLRDAIRIGEAVGRGDEARRDVDSLRRRLGDVERTAAGLRPPAVGCIEWLDPPFSAGHWVPEMVRLAGGRELFAGPGERSVRLTWEAVFEAAPEVLILMPCGFDAARAAGEAKTLPSLPGWSELPAVKNDRVWIVDANSFFSRPAPRLVEGVEILARILHPGVFPGAPAAGSASRLSVVPR
ncbi:ABC transporter substrate-binding protein [Rubrobacter tropicus]|uniref:ABC transporter substrate-binding protein n=1 Tax=Rubrobacter tropicus TaxID=2653851 RepID=A0A6G8QCP5_9ACTN|nr:cobalamin-binding protein [Rubrobacter tropicus]QIN84284.1 ABC transporter substrate-binding protein [Rubrobacter tropicus]